MADRQPLKPNRTFKQTSNTLPTPTKAVLFFHLISPVACGSFRWSLQAHTIHGMPLHRLSIQHAHCKTSAWQLPHTTHAAFFPPFARDARWPQSNNFCDPTLLKIGYNSREGRVTGQKDRSTEQAERMKWGRQHIVQQPRWSMRTEQNSSQSWRGATQEAGLKVVWLIQQLCGFNDTERQSVHEQQSVRALR